VHSGRGDLESAPLLGTLRVRRLTAAIPECSSEHSDKEGTVIKKKDVKIGGYYAIKHTSSRPGRLNIIQIISVNPYGGWHAFNLKTKREIVIKSNTKLRAEVERGAGGSWEVVAR
jgi:hypothetical protein